MSSGAEDWVFDSVIAFLKSPLWSTPLATFIDNNCAVFSGGEEDSLAYTQVHNEFKDLVETLLEYHLGEMGVSSEQFLAACERGNDDPISKAVFDTLLAAEDYLTFKEVMIARSKQLDRECLAMIQAMAAKPETVPEEAVAVAVEAEADEEGRALARAIRKSKRAAKKAKAKRKAVHREEDAQLRAAIAASLDDAEMARRRAEKEEADLRLAIARSLAMENAAAEAEQAAQASAAAGSDDADAAADAAKADALARAKAEAKQREKIASVAAVAAASLPPLPGADAAELEDARARQEYMARQRELLLRVKREERERSLKAYESEAGVSSSPAIKNKTRAIFEPAAPASPSSALPPLSGGSLPVGSVASASSVPSSTKPVEERLKLRRALTQKLRGDIVSSPDPKARSSVAAPAANPQVDDLRSQMEAERLAHLQAMHETLRASAPGDAFCFDE